MLKTMLKVVTLIFCVVTIVGSLSSIYLDILRGKSTVYAEMPYQIEFANTGSSHGLYGFDYSSSECVGFNFAMHSQSLRYDYNLISYYIDHFEKGAFLFIPISYFSFWGEEMEEVHFKSKNIRYLPILDAEHMKFQSETDRIINKYFAIVDVADTQVRSIVKAAPRGVENPSIEEYSLEEIGKLRAKYHISLIKDRGKTLPVNDDSIKAVGDLVEICKAHGVIPIIVTTPVLNEYSKWFSQDVLQVFYNELEGIQNKYGVTYLDFSKDNRFCSSSELFQDTDHLNEQGAKKFTDILVKQAINETKER